MVYPHDNLYRYNIIKRRVAISLFYLSRDKHLSYNFDGKNRTTFPRSNIPVLTHDFYITEYHSHWSVLYELRHTFVRQNLTKRHKLKLVTDIIIKLALSDNTNS